MHEDAQHAEFDLLMQSQFWPAPRLRDLQRERLEKLLRHARAHAPFYATRLEPVFRPDGSIDWDRWGELPIVKRDDLLTHRRAMLGRTAPEGSGDIRDIFTSGSTGTPVSSAHSTLSLLLSEAAVFRADDWYNLDYATRLGSWYGDRADRAAWPEGRRVQGWGPRWHPKYLDGDIVEVNRHTSAPNVLEFLVRKEANYLMGGGTDLRLLAHEAKRLGIALPLDVVMARSADITEPGRALVKEVFGARTVSLYSSKEGHRMAHPCPVTRHWHVNDEQVLVEILDSDDRPCEPGQSGRVVITPFASFAQPLIRYEQGDLAVRGGPCRCGRNLSVLTSITGRVKHMFVLADGRRVAPWLSDTAVAALNGQMFQIAQTAVDRIEVRYVRDPSGLLPRQEVVQDELQRLMEDDTMIDFVTVDSFIVPAGRKHLEFVSELDGQDVAKR